MMTDKRYSGLEIAIIGMSAQFPGSADCRTFWQQLKQGKELIKHFTDDELRQAGVAESAIRDDRYVRAMGVVDHKDLFDAAFFGYSPEESALMDPQIRLFHEHCWKALEDAGCASVIEKSKIGLFAGASPNYAWKLYAYNNYNGDVVDPFYLNNITSANFISTLVAYKLDLRGPSFYVDTACSTSLAAVHLACRSLLTKDCSIALAGGVYISTAREKGYFFKEDMILSSDGHCRTFDAMASGTVPGEGVGVVVLKKLNDAIRDKDHIYAVIRATAANNDGNHKVGYTAPGVKGQADCIRLAQQLAGVEPGSITYIEAHGTATRLGDPVEIMALTEAFGASSDMGNCYIGSVKTNIGHLDTAAGVAGLIKTALCLKHKQIPPSLHFVRPNPQIDFDNSPFAVVTELKDWHSNKGVPRRAGVSSLGIGGTNVHVVMEEAPEPEQTGTSRPFNLLTVSAKTGNALSRYMDDLRRFILDARSVNLPDMCYTLQTGRKHFAHRRSITFKDKDDLLRLLDAGEWKARAAGIGEGGTVVFMFPGQGAQYEDMAKGLYEHEPLIREEMDNAFSIIEGLTGEKFKDILFPSERGADKINQTRYTQPILFLLEYALARWLLSIGIEPRYMIGHSVGTYVSACISGIFSLADALKLVVKRGQLMNGLPAGNMISVPVSPAAVTEYLGKGVSLAAINAPEQIVLSGEPAAISVVTARLEQQNIPYVRLRTSHAFHSDMLDPVLKAFESAVMEVQFNKMKIPFISDVTGDLITEEEARSPQYWVRHMRETVKFSDGIKTLLRQSKELIFVEAGPGDTLSRLLKQHAGEKRGVSCVDLVRTFKKQEDDAGYLTRSLGRLWELGTPIDWSSYYSGEQRRKVSLPTYSFEPVRYPTEVDAFKSIPSARTTGTLNRHLNDCIYYPSWKLASRRAGVRMAGRRGYLLFLPDYALAEALKDKLLKDGDVLVTVLKGEKFSKVSPERFTVDPGSADQFHRLFDDLHSNDIDITHIVYGWAMLIDSSKLELREGNREIYLTYFSAVRLLQVLLKRNSLREKQFIVLTNALHRVVGTEQVSYAQALLLGLANTLQQEHMVICRNIDVNLNENTGHLTAALASEISNDVSIKERVIAIRHGQRWCQDHQREANSLEGSNAVLKKRGVYLITGGLGNLGFELAKYLIRQLSATVILVGRSEHPENTHVGDAAGRFAFLRSLGDGEVQYYSLNVADRAALENVVATAESRLGKIDGIIHAAGVIGNEYFEWLEDTTVEKALKVLAPKVAGVINILEVFRTRRPDFVWIASSLSATLGGLRFSAYGAANLFMHHFVDRYADVLPWKCIALSELSFTDNAVGREGVALAPAEIVALFEWSLSVNETRVILQTREELEERLQRAYSEKDVARQQEDAPQHTVPKLSRPDQSQEYAAPETATEERLKAVFENFFGIADIGVMDDFFELGGDSLKGMMILKRIHKEFNINLPLKELLLHTNVRQLAAKIDELVWTHADASLKNEITI